MQLKPRSDEIHALTTEVEHWDTRRFKIRTKWTRTSPLLKVSHHRLYPKALQIAAQGQEMELRPTSGKGVDKVKDFQCSSPTNF
jgi:hypothetical protein